MTEQMFPIWNRGLLLMPLRQLMTGFLCRVAQTVLLVAVFGCTGIGTEHGYF